MAALSSEYCLSEQCLLEQCRPPFITVPYSVSYLAITAKADRKPPIHAKNRFRDLHPSHGAESDGGNQA